MKIKKIIFTKNSSVEYNGSIYDRIETSRYIIWQFLGNHIFEYDYTTDKWAQKVNDNWTECKQPEIETQYSLTEWKYRND